jgi:multidrug efflux system membrane fusion protein
MNYFSRRVAIHAFCSLALAFVVLACLNGCKGQLGADDDDQATLPNAQKGPAQIAVVKGETVITLDPATQTRLGLAVATLTTTTSHAQQSFPAVVISPADLVTARTNLLAAQAQVQKAQFADTVANKEYSRLKALYANDQNVSQKSLEAAQGTAEADQTDVATAQQDLNLQKSLIAQSWGDAIANWAQQNSPAFERIIDQRDALVQVTLPADASLNAPKSLAIENLDGSKTQASLVSAFPRVDARVQGRNFLYVMPSRSPAAPDTNLIAQISVGSAMRGVVVPTSAVVWSEGRAWVYQQTGASQFTRRAVSTDLPLANGYFVSQGLPTEDKVVTVGAQALLSEEFLLRGASAGENDD